jgi:putative transposase
MCRAKALVVSTRSRARLQLELLALRHQVQVLQRIRPRRVSLAMQDRWLWVCLSRVWTAWRIALVIVEPATVVASHRRGFGWFWRWKSRPRTGVGDPRIQWTPCRRGL